MKIVLLPGLDGTGILFKPFTEIAPSRYSVEIIPLDQVPRQDAVSQAQLISSALPTDPFVLVAESYSGRIAYELLKRGDIDNLVHVFFVASFLRNPTWLSSFASFIPAVFLKNRLLLEKAGSHVVFGNYRNSELSELFSEAVLSAGPDVIKSRIKEIRHMVQPDKKIPMTTTYIQASNEIYVDEEVLKDFKTLFERYRVVRLEGTHFLMQTNPQGVWEVIEHVAV